MKVILYKNGIEIPYEKPTLIKIDEKRAMINEHLLHIVDICHEVAKARAIFEQVLDKIDYFIESYIKNVDLLTDLEDSKYSYIQDFCIMFESNPCASFKPYHDIHNDFIVSMYIAAIEQYESILSKITNFFQVKKYCQDISMVTLYNSRDRLIALQHIKEIENILETSKMHICNVSNNDIVCHIQKDASKVFCLKILPYMNHLKEAKTELDK